uniref:Nucleolar protein 6 n=1 Tax=Lygus hesperus TaxID=30085 RepID=A0A0A9YTL6_LYGHE
MRAVNEVHEMIASLPKDAFPCKLVGFDMISESERQTAVYPHRPHYALTYHDDDLCSGRYAGLSTCATIEPLHCVLTIDDSKHKIPDTLEGVALMKGALCAQLARVLNAHYGGNNRGGADCRHTDNEAIDGKNKAKQKYNSNNDNKKSSHSPQNDEDDKPKYRIRSFCTTHSVDLVHCGFLFRLYIAHYREVSLLKALGRANEAALLEQRLF